MKKNEGFLLINKPVGITSHEACRQLRKTLNTRAIGHSGSLDPFATGLLLVGVGEATKWMQYLPSEPKIYQARLKLGVLTDTGDCEGKTIAEQAIPECEKTDIEAALDYLCNLEQQQVPDYAAVKVNGRPLYDYARAQEPVPQVIKSIRVWQSDYLNHRHNSIDFSVAVSSGTYVRALGVSLARRLGTVGHLTALKRLSIAHLSGERATELNDVSPASFQPYETIFAHLPQLLLSEADQQHLARGRRLNYANEHNCLALYSDGGFFGIGCSAQGQLRALRLRSQCTNALEMKKDQKKLVHRNRHS